MKVIMIIISLIIASPASRASMAAQNSPGYVAAQIIYEVFGEHISTETLVSVVVRPSFEDEYVVGIEKSNNGYLGFALTVNQSVKKVSLRQSYEAGLLGKVDEHGNVVHFRQDPAYQALLPATPSNYADIKVQRQQNEVSRDFATSVIQNACVLVPVRPETGSIKLDGVDVSVVMGSWSVESLRAAVQSPTNEERTDCIEDLAKEIRRQVLLGE